MDPASDRPKSREGNKMVKQVKVLAAKLDSLRKERTKSVSSHLHCGRHTQARTHTNTHTHTPWLGGAPLAPQHPSIPAGREPHQC